jgi:apolipoprotein D and lipocalin family protein
MRSALRTTMALLAPLAAACGPGRPPLEVVPHVDLVRYSGRWYEIAAFPSRFEAGCVGTTATYSVAADGTVDLVSACRHERADGALRVVRGSGRVVDPATNAKLEVSFEWPLQGTYWIVDLDPDYRWAVVGSPSRDHLWILARAPTMDPAVYDAIVQRITALDFDPERLRATPQPAADEAGGGAG